MYKQPEPLSEIVNESIVNEEADPEVPSEDVAQDLLRQPEV